jgi:hypothetical protein
MLRGRKQIIGDPGKLSVASVAFSVHRADGENVPELPHRPPSEPQPASALEAILRVPAGPPGSDLSTMQ